MKLHPMVLKVFCDVDELENGSVAERVAEHFKDFSKLNTKDLTDELLDCYHEADVERYALHNEGSQRSKNVEFSMYMGCDDDRNSLVLNVVVE
ncbi:TPA: hypothetical protein ACPYXD_005363 [Enterobacter hormaechei subsp. xiangfangensis]